MAIAIRRQGKRSWISIDGSNEHEITKCSTSNGICYITYLIQGYRQEGNDPYADNVPVLGTQLVDSAACEGMGCSTLKTGENPFNPYTDFTTTAQNVPMDASIITIDSGIVNKNRLGMPSVMLGDAKSVKRQLTGTDRGLQSVMGINKNDIVLTSGLESITTLDNASLVDLNSKDSFFNTVDNTREFFIKPEQNIIKNQKKSTYERYNYYEQQNNEFLNKFNDLNTFFQKDDTLYVNTPKSYEMEKQKDNTNMYSSLPDNVNTMVNYSEMKLTFPTNTFSSINTYVAPYSNNEILTYNVQVISNKYHNSR